MQGNGITIEYDTLGAENGEPLLLVMGLGAQMTRWPDALCGQLVRHGFRVIRFDNRDVGLSTHCKDAGVPDAREVLKAKAAGQTPDVPYTLDDMAADAVAVLDGVGVEKAHIVGASMGGMIAQLVAADYPDRVLSLTSIFSTTGNPDLPPATPEALAVITTPAPHPSDEEAFVAHSIKNARVIGSPAYPLDEAYLRERAVTDAARAYDPAGVGAAVRRGARQRRPPAQARQDHRADRRAARGGRPAGAGDGRPRHRCQHPGRGAARGSRHGARPAGAAVRQGGGRDHQRAGPGAPRGGHGRRRRRMSLKHAAFIAGAWEHPTRLATDRSTPQLHAECARGALADAGLSKDDVDGYFCAGDAPGFGALSMADYMGLKLRHVDSTETGGSAPLVHVAHAAEAIAAGRCSVALITLAGRPRSEPLGRPGLGASAPESGFEAPYGGQTANLYGMCATRHMYEFGTTSEQLAWIKVAASHHAQHNPNAMLKDVVTVEDVVNSPMIADPLHRLDCCVVSDGGGALIVVAPEIARALDRPQVAVRGTGEAPKGPSGGRVDLTTTAAAWAGPAAFAEAGVTPADIQYASIYDSFTITVLLQLEDLGFCEKGRGGAFVADGNLISGSGKLPFNTDGGGLCSNHPSNRGGMTKVIEAVRQLRGEAHPAVQVPNCGLALASGIGGALGTRHGSGVLILERMA
jgi:acetyl-CoA C-acetyltransferase